MRISADAQKMIAEFVSKPFQAGGITRDEVKKAFSERLRARMADYNDLTVDVRSSKRLTFIAGVDCAFEEAERILMEVLDGLE